MSDQTLTHWKKLKHPDFIGAYALEPGKDLTLTIASVKNETFKGQDGKTEEGIIIRWKETDYKPMICNSTNAKAITKVTGSAYIEQWVGKQITLYAARIKAFGDDMEALRVRPYAPKQEQIDPIQAIKRVGMANSLDELKTIWSQLSKPEQGHPEVVKAKDAMKAKLTEGGNPA